ncbi:MAG: Na(+)-translocating NADH-quinone reductase subunit A [Woeseiaceae bacterium]|nr:Na(+)-translocating NADH-quinone reductase subunit A [Woeseiaceae bacterium]
MRIKIKKGLDIPISGEPVQEIEDARRVSSVGVLGYDVPGLRPSMLVEPGERVKLGQPLFFDKRNKKVPFTSPGAGVVSAVHRGERRILHSVVVNLDGSEEETFPSFDASKLDTLDADEARRIMLASGQWNQFRTRPFGRIPQHDAVPNSIFVTAIDTRPLAPDPRLIIGEDEEAFVAGAKVVSRLTEGATYVVTAPDSGIPVPENERFRHAEFEGPHPAGLPGTHIHFLDPVGKTKTVWHIGYQAVIGIGRLFLTGRLNTRKTIALAGPRVKKPRLLRTRPGASAADLIEGETLPGSDRVISGSVLAGHRATGTYGWLGRYHSQIVVLGEGSPREFLAWMRPGLGKYSATRAYAGHIANRGDFAMTTSQNGSPRAMVSTGAFERVMPLDILPTVLLKAIVVRDTDSAQNLGALELDDEDLALCSFVCSGKYDYGPHLRATLDEIEANG